LNRISLSQALLQFLGWDKQQLLEQLAPSKISVPTGNNIRIEYLPNGATPILAVRLQELFGMSDTPRINQGKTSLVLHLLSPGYKPVQVTSDLRSFWNNTYFEVKKELKRRYPKHAWPEDPWTALPVAKGRSMK
jgi:ATP-dependent helicase HrpB